MLTEVGVCCHQAILLCGQLLPVLLLQIAFLPFPGQPAVIKAAACSRDGKTLAVAAATGKLDGRDQKVTQSCVAASARLY